MILDQPWYQKWLRDVWYAGKAPVYFVVPDKRVPFMVEARSGADQLQVLEGGADPLRQVPDPRAD